VSEIKKNSTTIFENLKNFKRRSQKISREFEKISNFSENKRKPGKSKWVAKLSNCKK